MVLSTYHIRIAWKCYYGLRLGYTTIPLVLCVPYCLLARKDYMYAYVQTLAVCLDVVGPLVYTVFCGWFE